ncbi:helix-turn-helix domain-containing protein [bacterium]|nr:helix-turn-helix domain-containing protein [bacterium]MDC3185943.1 helix-turn-helix domain-containing protein [bacterium]
MNTEHRKRPIMVKNISLNSSQFMDLRRPQAGEQIKISVKTGVIRIGAEQTETDNACDVTLAFASRADDCEFNYPEDLDIRIEAITDTTYFVEWIDQRDFKNQDSILDWIIQLHIVRHETNLENRLMKLFQLLTTRLGKRTSQGLLLDHTLPHSRIAEMIGSTRSTVSRTISTLRKTKRIYIDELKNQIILPVD